jgi:hypothetical protein
VGGHSVGVTPSGALSSQSTVGPGFQSRGSVASRLSWRVLTRPVVRVASSPPMWREPARFRRWTVRPARGGMCACCPLRVAPPRIRHVTGERTNSDDTAANWRTAAQPPAGPPGHTRSDRPDQRPRRCSLLGAGRGVTRWRRQGRRHPCETRGSANTVSTHRGDTRCLVRPPSFDLARGAGVGGAGGGRSVLTRSTLTIVRGTSGAASVLVEHVGGEGGVGVGDPGLVGGAVGEGQQSADASGYGVFGHRWVSELPEFLERGVVVA